MGRKLFLHRDQKYADRGFITMFLVIKIMYKVAQIGLGIKHYFIRSSIISTLQQNNLPNNIKKEDTFILQSSAKLHI